MFGQGGSSQLTSGSTGFDLSVFDDVLVLNNVSFTGTVLSAQMSMQLLDTGNSKAANDTFFDFSGGYEDLALLSVADAYSLESANIGVAGAPTGITTSTTSPTVTESDVTAANNSGTTTTTTTTESSGSGSGSGSTPTAAPAAPAPAVMTVLVLCGLAFLGRSLRRQEKTPEASNLAA
jgi:hypothetical protein